MNNNLYGSILQSARDQQKSIKKIEPIFNIAEERLQWLENQAGLIPTLQQQIREQQELTMSLLNDNELFRKIQQKLLDDTISIKTSLHLDHGEAKIDSGLVLELRYNQQRLICLEDQVKQLRMEVANLYSVLLRTQYNKSELEGFKEKVQEQKSEIPRSRQSSKVKYVGQIEETLCDSQILVTSSPLKQNIDTQNFAHSSVSKTSLLQNQLFQKGLSKLYYHSSGKIPRERKGHKSEKSSPVQSHLKKSSKTVNQDVKQILSRLSKQSSLMICQDEDDLRTSQQLEKVTKSPETSEAQSKVTSPIHPLRKYSLRDNVD